MACPVHSPPTPSAPLGRLCSSGSFSVCSCSSYMSGRLFHMVPPLLFEAAAGSPLPQVPEPLYFIAPPPLAPGQPSPDNLVCVNGSQAHVAACACW